MASFSVCNTLALGGLIPILKEGRFRGKLFSLDVLGSWRDHNPGGLTLKPAEHFCCSKGPSLLLSTPVPTSDLGELNPRSQWLARFRGQCSVLVESLHALLGASLSLDGLWMTEESFLCLKMKGIPPSLLVNRMPVVTNKGEPPLSIYPSLSSHRHPVCKLSIIGHSITPCTCLCFPRGALSQGVPGTQAFPWLISLRGWAWPVPCSVVPDASLCFPGLSLPVCRRPLGRP